MTWKSTGVSLLQSEVGEEGPAHSQLLQVVLSCRAPDASSVFSDASSAVHSCLLPLISLGVQIQVQPVLTE